MITLSLPVMLGMLALVTEVGWAYWRQEACRTAAQAASVAAARQAQIAGTFNTASGIYTQSTMANCPASPTSPSTNNLMAGCLYAISNGFTNSGKQLVKYSAGTTNSPVTGSSPGYWVRYIVTESNPSLFSSVLGYKHVTASGMATAGVFLGVQGACIYALDPTADGAVTLGGNTIVNAGCGVYDNSNSPTALTCSNNTSLNAGNSTINVAGLSICGGAVTPTPNVNQPRTADPFQYLDPPTIPSRCDSTGLRAGSPVSMPSDGIFVICNGGITMKSNGTLNLPAGTYVVQGGGLDWENGTVNGTGVTIYNTGPNAGAIKVNGNMTVNLTAPTSGYYWGVVLFQDRTLTYPPAANLNGGSTMNFAGTIYLPGAAASYTGGSTSSVTALIADTITFTGTSYFGTDNNGAVTGLGRPYTALLE